MNESEPRRRRSPQGNTVIGGITYRVFDKQKVGEIAFCAVSASEQARPACAAAAVARPRLRRPAASLSRWHSGTSEDAPPLRRCAGEGLRHAPDEQDEGVGHGERGAHPPHHLCGAPFAALRRPEAHAGACAAAPLCPLIARASLPPSPTAHPSAPAGQQRGRVLPEAGFHEGDHPRAREVEPVHQGTDFHGQNP